MVETLSHYTLLEKIGAGGMGTVYRARDEMTGDTVAVKTLHSHLADDEEYIRRFEREALIAQSIASPNTVQVLDSGHDGETCFLVMEYIAGETLADHINQHGQLPVSEAVALTAAIARGLTAAHARFVVHRDVSPQNVLISRAGVAKVTDFGVSRDLTRSTMTATSLLMGKPLYIAPEIVTGASKADIRADVYALGLPKQGVRRGATHVARGLGDVPLGPSKHLWGGAKQRDSDAQRAWLRKITGTTHQVDGSD